MYGKTAGNRRSPGLLRRAELLCVARLCLTSVLVLRGLVHAEEGRVFQAGAATSNITPPLDEPIVGGWNSPAATHIHDELYARCLMLDDGRTKLVLVLVDSVGVAREVFDSAKESIRNKAGIPVENMLMAATHTHSSISVRAPNKVKSNGPLSDYQTFVARRISDGVRRAINNLEPARIGWGRAEEPTQVFNRRYFMNPGTPTPNPFGGTDRVVMNPGRGNPNIDKAAGPTDPEITFLSVQSTDGRPIALLANYSLHYVGPSAGSVISADYFGVFADRIQELLGADRLDPPFVGIMSNGTSGDINNINWLEKPSRRWPPYAKMRQVADLVARAVHQAHEQIEFHDWVPLDACKSELTLAVREPTQEQLAYARKIHDKPEDAPKHHAREHVYANRVLDLADAPEHRSLPLQVMRIGELGICAIPFEVFVEIGLELKQKSPMGQTFTISHANGSYGYLPTVRHHELGGYETWLGTNNVEVQAAPKIVDASLSMLRDLHAPVTVDQ
ncbi:MAG: neutral/alkaline non-lysosomal ceramidase N-terminal domain-containing protein [Phycisphaerales bacterium]|nr:MAG: neutral/alkaline non-lysosomal ceramidase N-terminal domain-containing protein [Phycisphaerales bacterium]